MQQSNKQTNKQSNGFSSSGKVVPSRVKICSMSRTPLLAINNKIEGIYIFISNPFYKCGIGFPLDEMSAGSFFSAGLPERLS